MNTTRIDHTGCTHDRTPRGRAACRDMRRQDIKTAQQAYMALWTLDEQSGEKYDEYYALVDNVRFRIGCSLAEAYDIVERGPII